MKKTIQKGMVVAIINVAMEEGLPVGVVKGKPRPNQEEWWDVYISKASSATEPRPIKRRIILVPDDYRTVNKKEIIPLFMLRPGERNLPNEEIIERYWYRIIKELIEKIWELTVKSKW